MPIKIFHTADLHIGMKFNSYPEPIKSKLQEARLEVLLKMLSIANKENCNLFVVAGDLFHNIKGINKKAIVQTAQYLEEFQGECVLILPGNHDYDNDRMDFWDTFKNTIGDKTIFLDREAPVSLIDYGLDVTVYPAPCHSKHSDTNNIGWIGEQKVDSEHINIGIAHGSLQGISPDIESSYFYMTPQELENLPMDLWLLGHTHVAYPVNESIKDWKVFNPGTPEPDGLDCWHNGHAWLIDVDDHKRKTANLVLTGTYRFLDKNYTIADSDDLDQLQAALLKEKPETTIARIHLAGRVSNDTYSYRKEIFKTLEQTLAYLIIDDFNLGIKITPEKISQEFTEGSFPQQLLKALTDDEDAMQMAYELIMGVRK
ncbi:MAG: metallophosphoesterase family protein [Syntrophomonadaceae bacterium]|jgi:exonuclease SbcD